MPAYTSRATGNGSTPWTHPGSRVRPAPGAAAVTAPGPTTDRVAFGVQLLDNIVENGYHSFCSNRLVTLRIDYAGADAAGYSRDAELEQRHWVCSGAAARRDLKWAPKVQWPEGVKLAAEWYRRKGGSDSLPARPALTD